MQLCDLPPELLARLFHGPGNLFYHGHVVCKALRRAMLEHTHTFPRPVTRARALFDFERLAKRGLYSEAAMCSLLPDVVEDEAILLEAVQSWRAKNEGRGEELLGLCCTPKRSRGLSFGAVQCMHRRSPYVFCGLRCGRVLVCDERTLRVLKTLEGSAMVTCVTSCLMPWGCTRLVTGHWYPNNFLTVWDAEDTRMLSPAHAHGIRCCEMSPCERFLVTASEDRTIKVWDIFPLVLRGVIEVDSVVQSLVVTAEGLIVSGREDGHITVYRLHTLRRAWSRKVHAHTVAALVVVGELLVSACAGGTVVASELGGRFVRRYVAPGSCTSLAVGAGGLLLCGGHRHDQGFVVVLDAALRWQYTSRLPHCVFGLLHSPAGTLALFSHGVLCF